MATNTKDLKPKDPKRVDEFSTKNAGSYNIKNHVYPTGVSELPDMQHYVTFFINVRGKSKFLKKEGARTVMEVTSAHENRLDNQKMSRTAIAAGAAMGAIGAVTVEKGILGKGGAASAAFTRSINKGDSVLKATLKGAGTVAATAAAGAVVGALVANALIEPDKSYRISDCITLYLPQAPSVHYNAQYDTVEIGALGGIIAGGSSAVDSVDGFKYANDAVKALVLSAAKLPGNLVSSGQIKAAIEVTNKQTLNPYREALFKSIGFRKFAFDYRFFPKNQDESAAVQEIIKTFKYHMHPELSEGGLFYIHPSEFNIQYYFAGKENTYFNKISTCVLEDVQVQYGSQEGVTSFKDGAPAEIHMRLTFQEIETLTKERIDEGY